MLALRALANGDVSPAIVKIVSTCGGKTRRGTGFGDLILESVREFAVMEIAYDRRFANPIVTRMERHGVPMIPFGQSTANVNAGTRELLRMVAARSFSHGGNPVFQWMCANTAKHETQAG